MLGSVRSRPMLLTAVCLTNNSSVGRRQQSTVIYPRVCLLGATASSLVAAAFCKFCLTDFHQSKPDLLNHLDTNLVWHIWNDGLFLSTN